MQIKPEIMWHWYLVTEKNSASLAKQYVWDAEITWKYVKSLCLFCDQWDRATQEDCLSLRNADSFFYFLY